MREAYYQFLQQLKTYMNHHGRGVVLSHNFELFPVPPETLHALEARPVGSLASHEPPPLSEHLPSSPLHETPPPDPTRPNLEDLPVEGLTMEDLQRIWAPCMACGLGASRGKMVFGEGAVPAPLFFIGEGPGANEDKTGRPFVGKAGQLLDKMIAAMGLRRDQVYIGNIVKCRPPNNRDPEMPEMLSCMPVLERQIELVQPKAIVTLGRIAAQALLSTTRPLGRLRGTWHDYRGVRLLPTYHPAYLLRNPSAKVKSWDDLQLVMAELGLTPGA